MAVPARPVEGAPVDVTWGGVAHDTAVAMDIQAGTLSTTHASAQISNAAAVTFPRAFAAGSTPVVVVGSGNFNYGAALNGGAPTATGFVTQTWRYSGATASPCPVWWIAYGPRA